MNLPHVPVIFRHEPSEKIRKIVRAVLRPTLSAYTARGCTIAVDWQFSLFRCCQNVQTNTT